MAHVYGSRTTDGRGRIIKASIATMTTYPLGIDVDYVPHERDRRHLADDATHSEVAAVRFSFGHSALNAGGAKYLRETLDLILEGSMRESEIARLRRELEGAQKRCGDAEEAHADAHEELQRLIKRHATPIPMRLACEACGELHIDDEPGNPVASKPHHTHVCQFCGLTWRPAVVPTVGVRFLPGFKNTKAP